MKMILIIFLTSAVVIFLMLLLNYSTYNGTVKDDLKADLKSAGDQSKIFLKHNNTNEQK
jgi:heme/copper-type cytochrome/quinol oxidase subunit 3